MEGGERRSECAAYTFSNHLQSLLHYLETFERGEGEVGRAAWVVKLVPGDTLGNLGSAQVLCFVVYIDRPLWPYSTFF